MAEAAGRPAPVPHAEHDARLELERKRLNLRVLLVLAQELSGVLQPRTLLDIFLLTAMGPTGARQGVAVLATPTAGDLLPWFLTRETWSPTASSDQFLITRRPR